jgi:PAS domain S-box-containing protein
MITNSLALTTALKASQALSSELQMDQLLATLLKMVLESTEANRGILLMPQQQDWFIEAVAVLGQPVAVQTIALADSDDLPHSLIQHVQGTMQPQVIIDAMTDPSLATDRYVIERQPKSLLCKPIVHQGKLVAILHLENHAMTGAFTRDRLELLNILCSQAAISLENARLYQQAQQKTTDLKAFQARLQFLIQQTPIGVIEWNADFKVIGWNPAAEKIFGYTAAEMLNQHAVEIVPESDRALVAEVMQALMQQTGGFSSLNGNLRKNQQLITCEWTNTPLKDAQGNAIGIFSMVQDVSDRITAEQTILQKSAALEQAMTELQSAQLQTVQSEKMASLGNLVAGVAHEINNPIGFLNGSLNNANEYVNDLIAHLALYQQHSTTPIAQIQDNAAAIDLDFLCDDLPKLLNSMQSATNRIKSISTSLRTFSRADTEHKVKANLHEGLDSTLLILKYRLKANDVRPAIETVQAYSELATIDCFPGQLNQVFMNILANAIDVFDEMAQHQTFAELKAHPQQISIQTEQTDEQVIIRIRDNGKGMDAATRARIFDHLFTTKGVGQGTGLGLAIARQIIVEKHGGSIEVQSEVGQGTEFILKLPTR